MISAFSWLGRIEGTSLLLLFFFAMPLKYLMGQPEAVRWIGMIHGLLFILYVSMAFAVASELKWTKRTLLLCLVLSSVPFGTFYFEHRYLTLRRSIDTRSPHPET